MKVSHFIIFLMFSVLVFFALMSLVIVQIIHNLTGVSLTISNALVVFSFYSMVFAYATLKHRQII